MEDLMKEILETMNEDDYKERQIIINIYIGSDK